MRTLVRGGGIDHLECAEADAEEAHADNNTEFFWLVTDADDAYDELGLDPTVA
ncbi:MAG: hypothetical protein IIB90_17805 [Gemmatimonadetes bacterium]|nr:hypothetical protein [Gemmatimonadota bacterium]